MVKNISSYLYMHNIRVSKIQTHEKIFFAQILLSNCGKRSLWWPTPNFPNISKWSLHHIKHFSFRAPSHWHPLWPTYLIIFTILPLNVINKIDFEIINRLQRQKLPKMEIVGGNKRYGDVWETSLTKCTLVVCFELLVKKHLCQQRKKLCV